MPNFSKIIIVLILKTKHPVNYLVATGKPVGLIFDFGESKVEFKRRAKKYPVNPVILSKIRLALWRVQVCNLNPVFDKINSAKPLIRI